MERDKKDRWGPCDICQQKAVVRRLAKDHDHGNGKWRGLLCHKCNFGLGWFKDDPKRLRRAADYVSYWQTIHYRPEDTDVTFEQWAEIGTGGCQ